MKSIIRRLKIYHITFSFSISRLTVGVKFHYACTDIYIPFLCIQFWHEHNIVYKYPYPIINPKSEVISKICDDLTSSVADVLTLKEGDRFSTFGCEEVTQWEDDLAIVELKLVVNLERRVDEVRDKEIVDRAQREYGYRLSEWGKLPWYMKVFPQLIQQVDEK